MSLVPSVSFRGLTHIFFKGNKTTHKLNTPYLHGNHITERYTSIGQLTRCDTYTVNIRFGVVAEEILKKQHNKKKSKNDLSFHQGSHPSYQSKCHF